MIMMMIFHQNAIAVEMKKLKKEKLSIIMMNMIMMLTDHQNEAIKQEKITNVVILQHRLTFV